MIQSERVLQGSNMPFDWAEKIQAKGGFWNECAARSIYVAQIVISLVSIPFILLTALYDILSNMYYGSWNLVTEAIKMIPLTLYGQIGVMPFASFLAAITSKDSGLSADYINYAMERYPSCG